MLTVENQGLSKHILWASIIVLIIGFTIISFQKWNEVTHLQESVEKAKSQQRYAERALESLEDKFRTDHHDNVLQSSVIDFEEIDCAFLRSIPDEKYSVFILEEKEYKTSYGTFIIHTYAYGKKLLLSLVSHKGQEINFLYDGYGEIITFIHKDVLIIDGRLTINPHSNLTPGQIYDQSVKMRKALQEAKILQAFM